MKITKIKRLVSFGNHENIEMEAEIQEFDDVTACHQKLLDSIRAQISNYGTCLSLTLSAENLEQLIQSKLNRKQRIESDIESLEKRKAKIEAWLEKFNINPNAFDPNEIPF